MRGVLAFLLGAAAGIILTGLSALIVAMLP
jgi:hypothetical protein